MLFTEQYCLALQRRSPKCENGAGFKSLTFAPQAEALRMVEDKRASSTELYDIAPVTTLGQVADKFAMMTLRAT